MNLALPLDTAQPEVLHPLHDRLPREQAETAVSRLRQSISSAVSVCKLAGSARRLKATVKDIEFVCIERTKGALLNAIRDYLRNHKRVLEVYVPVKGERLIRMYEPVNYLGGTYHLQVEWFISQPEYFGWTYFIRTGSQDFNKAVIAKLHELGYTIDDNKLFKEYGFYTQIKTEQELFNILRSNFIEPHNRHGKDSLLDGIFALSQGVNTCKTSTRTSIPASPSQSRSS